MTKVDLDPSAALMLPPILVLASTLRLLLPVTNTSEVVVNESASLVEQASFSVEKPSLATSAPSKSMKVLKIEVVTALVA